eukprot:scaffold294921_cov24-Tisochrysis_lutea.AAC.1
MAAQLTSPSSLPNLWTAMSIIAWQSSAQAVSALMKTASHCGLIPLISSTTARPRSSFRPQTSTAAAFASAAHLATSLPSPPVEPVTTSALPERSARSLETGGAARPLPSLPA